MYHTANVFNVSENPCEKVYSTQWRPEDLPFCGKYSGPAAPIHFLHGFSVRLKNIHWAIHLPENARVIYECVEFESNFSQFGVPPVLRRPWTVQVVRWKLKLIFQTGALEAQNFLRNGQLVNLSEEHLVACSASYGNAGCDGGWPASTFDFTLDNMGMSFAFLVLGILW